MRFRHPDVVEEGFAERRIPGDQQDRLCGHALRGHVEQDEADAVMLLGRGVGAHQAKDPVGVVGIARPDLLAVDDVIVAVALGAGLQGGEVRSGVRLGVALAPADLAAAICGRCSGFCASVPYFSSAGPSIQMPKLDSGERAPIGVHLLAQRPCASPRIEPAAAVLLRPVWHGPAFVAHPLEPDALRPVENLGSRPPQTVSASEVIGCAAFPADNWLRARRGFHCEIAPRSGMVRFQLKCWIRP